LNKAVEEVEENLHGGVGLVHITKGNLEKILIPLPPLDVQNQIVSDICTHEAEIERLEASILTERNRISEVLAHVWGEDSDLGAVDQ
jgi:restriction endonuclease S subunit